MNDKESAYKITCKKMLQIPFSILLQSRFFQANNHRLSYEA